LQKGVADIAKTVLEFGMLVSVWIGSILYVSVGAAVAAPAPAKAAVPPVAGVQGSFSSAASGMPQLELRARFRAALNKAYRAPKPPPVEQYWVLRAFERDLDVTVGSTSFAQSLAAQFPDVAQAVRLQGRPVDKRVAQFYAADAPAVMAARKVHDTTFSFRFLYLCSPARAAENEKIYNYLLHVVTPAMKGPKPPGGDVVFLTQLRDRECLSETQYKRLVTPSAEKLGAELVKFPPAEMVGLMYYLVHAGFGHLVPPEAVARMASEQDAQGDWPVGMHVNYVTPFQGAYVWAYIMKRDGTPLTLADFKGAVASPPEALVTGR
jgi:hypothetical protein